VCSIRRAVEVGDVRQGKYIEVELKEKDRKKAEAAVEKMCAGLLANTVIENYKYELAE
jgi:phosphoribosylformylglycinamidine synthase subunit PurS